MLVRKWTHAFVFITLKRPRVSMACWKITPFRGTSLYSRAYKCTHTSPDLAQMRGETFKHPTGDQGGRTMKSAIPRNEAKIRKRWLFHLFLEHTRKTNYSKIWKTRCLQKQINFVHKFRLDPVSLIVSCSFRTPSHLHQRVDNTTILIFPICHIS